MSVQAPYTVHTPKNKYVSRIDVVPRSHYTWHLTERGARILTELPDEDQRKISLDYTNGGGYSDKFHRGADDPRDSQIHFSAADSGEYRPLARKVNSTFAKYDSRFKGREFLTERGFRSNF